MVIMIKAMHPAAIPDHLENSVSLEIVVRSLMLDSKMKNHFCRIIN